MTSLFITFRAFTIIIIQDVEIIFSSNIGDFASKS